MLGFGTVKVDSVSKRNCRLVVEKRQKETVTLNGKANKYTLRVLELSGMDAFITP